jgi:hypothetical protein
MRHRLAAVAAIAVVALVACAPEPVGPAAPIAREQMAGVPALDASAARQTVVDFLRTYAASASDGVAPVARLVAGDALESWVRWLDIQHREFTGSIVGAADVRDVEFVRVLEAQGAAGAEVGLSATVTFVYDPVDAEPFERARILDGPVTLVRTAAGGYRVIDFVRDGIPMSDGIQLFARERRTEGGVTVILDSLYMFTPNWQFNIVVRNASGVDLEVDPDATGLIVQDAAGTRLEAGAITRSLGDVGPGDVDGIIAFPLQDSAEGRTLALTYRRGDRLLRFTFPLADVVDAVPPLPPATGISGSTA